MPYIPEWAPEEKEKLDKHWNTGLYTEQEWGTIIQRIFEDDKRDGSIDRAFTNNLMSRIGRETAGICRAVEEPEIMLRTAQQFSEERGIFGGLGEIAASSFTAPGEILREIASGREIEGPLQSIVGLAQFLPITCG